MNAERLLQHYQRTADAPDAIARLRRFILDLAVRGKLTSYQFRQEEVFPLGELSEFIMGQAPPGNSYNEEGNGTVFVKVGEFGERFPVKAAWTTEPLKFATEGDVLICVVGATIGKLNLAIDCAIGRSVAAIRPQSRLAQVFLYYSLMPVTTRLREDARGTAQGVISRPDLAAIPIWLPPLVEQQRIVAKVDELMGLCDQLEAAKNTREATRDRLTAASLARLNAPDPETFPADARFALDALPALTTRTDQIKQLRQTILNLAARGKLVPQNPNDEPAAELLQRIAEDKARRVKNREIRHRDIQPPIASGQHPFLLPDSWVWTRLGTLCFLITDGAHHTPSYQDEGIPFLSVKDVSSGSIDFGNTRYVSREAHLELIKRCNPEFGDLLLTKVGTTGIAVEVDTHQEFSIFVSLALLKFSNENVDRRFLCHLINSPFVRQQSAENTQGIGNKNLVLRLINQFLIPLPPLAEQRRIVKKVDELMALCDRLETSLTATAATRRRLLDALLAEALAPIPPLKLEAAE